MKNNLFSVSFCDNGSPEAIYAVNDPFGTNWLVDREYMNTCHYPDSDKLLGEFTIIVDGIKYTSSDCHRELCTEINSVTVYYTFENFLVTYYYSLDLGDSPFSIDISFENTSTRELTINSFGAWFSANYIMYRDKDVLRNMHQSSACFPSISPNYMKLAFMRRSNQAPHMGLFLTKGCAAGVGTFCRYTNLFFENVSPSLDGIIFHQLMLVDDSVYNDGDWLSNHLHTSVTIHPGNHNHWDFSLIPCDSKEDYYQVSHSLGHPLIEAAPSCNINNIYTFKVQIPDRRIVRATAMCKKDGLLINSIIDIPKQGSDASYILSYIPDSAGEHKIILKFDDSTVDCFVFNVMEPLGQTFSKRCTYLLENSYTGEAGLAPHAFLPLSNQGESLGKVNLLLMNNLSSGTINYDEVRAAEYSTIYYIMPKWFIDSDYMTPAKLYNGFYRVMDFEYIANTLFLLSQFDNDCLTLHNSDFYLKEAANVFRLRIDPSLHNEERAREETTMAGSFFIYANELINALKNSTLIDDYNLVTAQWERFTLNLQNKSSSYTGAITEHYYDNAGFGPCSAALCMSNHLDGGRKYAELLYANIGFSNDFRNQNPDRWWEALSYMIHSLWGGLSAASMLICYENLHDTKYLIAAYNATVAVLYCYDYNSSSTGCALEPGQAVSTYSTASPHLNRPDLSHKRFGQSVFSTDGGIFARLFPDGDSVESDWDMGEEMVAYLNGFGKKTFLYYDKDHNICCVNGYLESKDDMYIIHSYAPYPEEYHFYDLDLHESVHSSSISFDGKKFIL